MKVTFSKATLEKIAPLLTLLLLLCALAAGYAYLDAGCVRNNVGQCSFTLGTMG